MGQNWEDSEFEGYRRDRKRRHLEVGGVKRDLGRHPSVLRELEAAEQSELQNERLSREVHEFFSDATRTAAEIVSRVAEVQESRRVANVQQDMVEFLSDAVARVQQLITQFSMRHGLDPDGLQDVEPMIRNIVGRQLDQFRNEGTAQLADKHIGQDPFATEVAPAESEASSPSEEPLEIEEHLVAELVPQPDEDEEPENPTYQWIQELRDDADRLAKSLKCLVANGLMEKPQALAVYRELNSAT